MSECTESKFPNTCFFSSISNHFVLTYLFSNIFLGLTPPSATAHSLISSLVQINCLILTHHIVYGRNERRRIALVEVLECLLSTNFVLVGMKMAMLSHKQVNDFLALVGSKSDSKQNLVSVYIKKIIRLR